MSKNVIVSTHNPVSSVFKGKHMVERPSKRDQKEVEEKNSNLMALVHKKVASSEHCMTSLTSSGIGSMKSSTVSVTTGSPLPGHFILGTLDSMHRPDPCTSYATDVIGNCSSKHLDHCQVVEVASPEVKKTTVSSNSEDMFNLTDVDDVDTSGIFSISETTPIKKHKTTSSQKSHEKDYRIPENILENEVVNSKQNISSKNTFSQNVNASEKYRGPICQPFSDTNQKAILTHEIGTIDGDFEPIQQIEVQNANTLNVVKRERLNSESQTRRKGMY